MHIDSAVSRKIFGASIPVWVLFFANEPKKSSITLPPWQSTPGKYRKLISFLWNLSKYGHLNAYLWVRTLSHEKTCSSYIPNPKYTYLYLSNMQQVTIQKNLNPVYTWFKTINFYIQLVIYWGESGLLLKFYLFIISVEKK